MPVTKSRLDHFTFDDAIAESLKAYLDNAKLPVQPVQVGYSFLPDFYGNDVIRIMTVLPSNFDVESISKGVLKPMNRAIWEWVYEEFPDWSPAFYLELNAA